MCVCVCVCVYMYVYMYVCMYVCMTCMHIYIYMCVCVYVCMYDMHAWKEYKSSFALISDPAEIRPGYLSDTNQKRHHLSQLSQLLCYVFIAPNLRKSAWKVALRRNWLFDKWLWLPFKHPLCTRCLLWRVGTCLLDTTSRSGPPRAKCEWLILLC